MIMRKMKKPKVSLDWDDARKKVKNIYGEEFVLFNADAKRVYKANKTLYKKYRK